MSSFRVGNEKIRDLIPANGSWNTQIRVKCVTLLPNSPSGTGTTSSSGRGRLAPLIHREIIDVKALSTRGGSRFQAKEKRVLIAHDERRKGSNLGAAGRWSPKVVNR